MLLFKAILTIEALGKRLEPTFDILEVGTRLARQVITSRYSKDRILHDLIIVGRDVHALVESLPRLLRRFLRTWSQNGFAFEHRNPDLARLGTILHQLTYHFLLGIFSLGFFALGIAFLFLDRGPEFLGFSLWSEMALSVGALSALYGMWTLRSTKK